MPHNKLRIELPDRVVIVCPASEYPAAVAALEKEEFGLEGRRLVESTGFIGTHINVLQHIFDNNRVTHVFCTPSVAEELYLEIRDFCLHHEIAIAQITL